MSGIFFTYRGKVDWNAIRNELADPEMAAYWGSKLLGHVKISSFNEKRNALVVAHFATREENRGLKIEGVSAGRALAIALQDAVRTNLNGSRIIFQENHSKYVEVGYPRFFQSLGAVARQGNHPKRSAWHWDWTGQVEGNEWYGEADKRVLFPAA